MAKPVPKGDGGGLSVYMAPMGKRGKRKFTSPSYCYIDPEPNTEGRACFGPRRHSVDRQQVNCCGVAQIVVI